MARVATRAAHELVQIPVDEAARQARRSCRVTPLFPLFGLAGAIPLPSKWHIEFCDPIDVTQYPKEAADDRAFVLELSERVRATIQERLKANLLKRRTPFW